MVHHRPVSSGFGDHRGAQFADAFREFIATNRVKMIVSMLRGDVARATENAEHNRETVAHFRAHPEVNEKSTDEMIARFEKSAAEYDKAIAWTNKLLARLESEPLPDEVITFDPLA